MRLRPIITSAAVAVGLLESCKPQTQTVERDARAASMGAGSGSLASSHCVTGKTDSAAAVVVALDTLKKRLGFDSKVHRFTREPHGYTIVTIPDPNSHALDPMGVVKVDERCRVTSLVLTDSA